MIRNAIWLLVAFAGAVVLALFFQGNHGDVTLTWPPYQVELSSNMLLVLLVAAFLVLHVLVLLVLRAIGLPKRIRRHREQRRLQRNNRSLQEAVLAHFEGRFDRAERLSAAVLANTSGRDRRDRGAAAALLAALSAHRLGNYARRDDWTRQAARRGARAAALMAKAEFALEDNQPEKALKAVGQISVGGEQQLLALEKALVGYGQAGRWEQVLETVRQLKRRGRLAPQEADGLRLTAYQQMLARRVGDPQALTALWKSLSAEERRKGALAAPTMTALAAVGETAEARRIGIGLLDFAYDEAVLEAYAALTALPARQRLEQLESWRIRHGEQPRLLEMLGRICASERLWGKAEGYLVDSLLAGDAVSARVALAQLYESVGRPQESALQFQYAARLALGERPPVPEPIGPGVLPGETGTAGARRINSPLPPDIPAPRNQGVAVSASLSLGQGGAPLQASAREVEAARGSQPLAATDAPAAQASSAPAVSGSSGPAEVQSGQSSLS
ncbi:MAG: heme biosynthesis HemY N-terminal domain-containing protein [Lautropia sp.]|nr:heme biosynthesis HemY N-terminal domain-containing protein [Lautropia sp.]